MGLRTTHLWWGSEFRRQIEMRIAVLTGGGDAPGLNAVIRALTKRATDLGHDVVGIRRGWSGLLDRVETVPLSWEQVSGIVGEAGTILLTSRTNPLKITGGVQKVKENLQKLGIDAVVAIGGDDTLSVAKALSEQGVKMVGVPKTIDNDVPGTDFTFGFLTAVEEATEALDYLKVTSAAHERVMVVEMMGRHAGWITLYSGMAAGADLILLPEEPFGLSDVIEFVKKRKREGKESLLIVVAEGAQIKDYAGPVTKNLKRDQFGNVTLGGIGAFLAEQVERATGFETRAVAPSHIVRGRRPIGFDRVLATRFGLRAAELVHQGKFGRMVALQGTRIVDLDLKDCLTGTRDVDVEFLREKKLIG